MSLSQGFQLAAESAFRSRSSRNPIFNVAGDGITPDSPAMQAWLDSSVLNEMPEGFYKVNHTLQIRSGQTIRGQGRTKTILIKDDFDGPVFWGNDVEDVLIENLSIVGPGAAVGVGNEGIRFTVALEEVNRSITVRNVTITDMNDVAGYFGSCSHVLLESFKTFHIGYASLLAEGGDGWVLNACRTRDDIVGYMFNRPAGFGPSAIAMNGCYAEQSGCGIFTTGANALTIVGGGVEAAINRNPTYPGHSIEISGFDGSVTIAGAVLRNDKVGVPITAPFIRIRAGAWANIVSVQRVLQPGVVQPVWELDADAGAFVILGQHNFPGGKIRGNGSIAVPNYTII